MRSLLLIENDESNRLTLSVLLEEEGYQVTQAQSFREAQEKLRAPGADYDLVLTDLHLGDGLGADLVEEIRERFSRAKVVLISGSLRPEDLPPGMDALVPKGTEFTVTLRIIQELIG